jgi:hypothetical protein
MKRITTQQDHRARIPVERIQAWYSKVGAHYVIGFNDGWDGVAPRTALPRQMLLASVLRSARKVRPCGWRSNTATRLSKPLRQTTPDSFLIRATPAPRRWPLGTPRSRPHGSTRVVAANDEERESRNSVSRGELARRR